jgi:hypothetical protein
MLGYLQVQFCWTKRWPMGIQVELHEMDGNDRTSSIGRGNTTKFLIPLFLHWWMNLIIRQFKIAGGVWSRFTHHYFSSFIYFQLLTFVWNSSLAAFTVTPERWGVVNFTLSLDAQPYTFMFARPKQLSRAYLFIQPYTVNVRSTTIQFPSILSWQFIWFRLGSWFLQWLWVLVRWFGFSITSPLTIGSILIVKDRPFSVSITMFGIASVLYFIRVFNLNNYLV